MEAQRFCDVINDLAYRPGWSFRAVEIPDGQRLEGGNVIITVAVETLDTNRECARDGYTTPKIIGDAIPIDAGRFDTSDDVAAFMFATIMDFEVHEAREFLRIKGEDYRAPFHPHREECREVWASYFE